ncbi:MAG TPA: hypothetical protein ENN67_03170, partial [Firmicutes bacterium]|nr:hypothetical protein [Bacillota bacterium]
VSSSPDALRAGIRPGLTPDAARKFMPELKFVEERPAVYFKAARTVQEVCERLIPYVDAERLDSFMLDLTGTDRLYPDPAKIMHEIQNTVSREVFLPSRAGLGTSRLIARLAAMQADELHVRFVHPGDEAAFLAGYSVTVLPGVGVKIAERLKWMGVRTVSELARVPVQTLEAAFGPKGEQLARAAQGHDPHPGRRAERLKPIRRESVLEQIFYDPLFITVALEKLVADLGLELRRMGMQTRSISLELRYPDRLPGKARKRIPPTDLDMLLIPIVKEMLSSAFTRRVRLKGLSLGYGKLIPRDDQLLLEFARDPSGERGRRLGEAMDRIRGKWGVEIIGPGVWWNKRVTSSPRH